jgi:hypothetical protein
MGMFAEQTEPGCHLVKVKLKLKGDLVAIDWGDRNRFIDVHVFNVKQKVIL